MKTALLALSLSLFSGLTFAQSFINSHVVTPEQLIILEKSMMDPVDQLSRISVLGPLCHLLSAGLGYRSLL